MKECECKKPTKKKEKGVKIKMGFEEKKEKVMDAIGDLNWSDDNIPEIMDGFFNNPLEVVEKAEGEMSEDHIQHLFELLDCKEDEDEVN